MIKISIVGLIAGTLAGLLGIGGGLVVSPILLGLGVRPEITTASSSFMILFSSTLAIILFISADLILYDYGIWLFCTAIIGSGTGILLIKRLVHKYNRSSIIVIVLAIILGLSALIILIYGIITTVQKEQDDEMEYGFKSIC